MANKAKTKKSKKTKKTPKPTAADVKVLRETADKAQAEAFTVEQWEHEQQLRKNYEKERPDLAPWIGWEEYREARLSEHRIKAIGIIGAIMRGEKRTEIRKKWRIGAGKLNEILNSDLVDDVLAYSLGNIYSFQTACVKAIMHELEINHDGHLALALLEKLEMFSRMQRLVKQDGAPEIVGKEGEDVHDAIGFLYASGDSIQARQAREAIEGLVVSIVKEQAPK